MSEPAEIETGWITAEELLSEQYPDPGEAEVLAEVETRLIAAIRGTVRHIEIEADVYKGLRQYMGRLVRIEHHSERGSETVVSMLEDIKPTAAELCFEAVFEHLRARGFRVSFEPEDQRHPTHLHIGW